MFTTSSEKDSVFMKRRSVTYVLFLAALHCGLLCTFSSLIGATSPNPIVSLNVAQPRYEAPMSLISSSSDEIVVSLKVPNVLLDTVTVGHTTYHTVRIPGWESTSEPGSPKLPLWRQLVAVPSCNGIVVTAEPDDSLIGNDYRVYPAERMIPGIGPDGVPYQEKKFEIDQSAYLSDDFYPKRAVQITDVFYIRDQKVVQLEVSPVRYNPSRRQLLVYSSLKIRLLPESPSGPVCTPTGPYDRVVERLVLGYDIAWNSPVPDLLSGPPLAGSVAWCHSVQECANHQTDYLMLVAGRFFQEGDSSSAAFRLAEHRASFDGFNVAIVSVEDLGLNIQAGPDTVIKVFIDSLYRTRTAEHMSDGHLGYTLLVGAFVGSDGDTLIPVHWESSHYPMWYGDYPSDNWFVAFGDTGVGGNPLPQLEIGRLAVIDDTDLSIVVDKLIRSEPLLDAPGWRTKLFLTSGWYMDDYERSVLEQTFSDLTEIAQAANYDTLLFRGDKQSQNYHFITENCRVINSGVRFVHYGIHGARCQMSAPPAFSTDSLACFVNSDSLPIFFTGACKTASFDTLCISSTDTVACIGAALVNHPIGGAVAFLGPADAGDLHVDFPACVDIFASWVKYHSPFVGDGWFEAKLRLGGSYFTRSFTLIGDPAFNVLLRESGVGYCDLGLREDEFDFDPDLDLSPLETVISISRGGGHLEGAFLFQGRGS